MAPEKFTPPQETLPESYLYIVCLKNYYWKEQALLVRLQYLLKSFRVLNDKSKSPLKSHVTDKGRDVCHRVCFRVRTLEIYLRSLFCAPQYCHVNCSHKDGSHLLSKIQQQPAKCSSKGTRPIPLTNTRLCLFFLDF